MDFTFLSMMNPMQIFFLIIGIGSAVCAILGVLRNNKSAIAAAALSVVCFYVALSLKL